MKVLLSHNYYRSSSPSGEDAVFEAERDLLRSRGVEVVTFVRRNDDIAGLSPARRLLLPLETAWSRRTYRELLEVLKKEKPDVAHFHNLWYLITPSAYWACREAGVPVVQTLHNFRTCCINGLFLRNGKICEDCLGKSPWRGALHGCWRGSRLASIPVSAAAARHRWAGVWTSQVDVHIALTNFTRDKFIAAGLPSRKIHVKPNFLAHPPEASSDKRENLLFLGRLSPEKGVAVLLDAVALLGKSGPMVTIVGDGPQRAELESRAKAGGFETVSFTGRLSSRECMALLRQAAFLSMPSLWYEGFPMSLLEAFAGGTPVIASRLGSLAELVEDGKTGLLFEPGNGADLAEKILWMMEHKLEREVMGRQARAVFDARYTADENHEMLIAIYASAIAMKKGS